MKNWSYNTYQTCVFVGMKTVYILKVEIKRTKTKIKAGPKNVGFWLKHVLCRLVLSLCSNVTVLAGILFLLHPPGLHRSYLRSPAEPVSISTSRKIFLQTQICSEFSVIFKEKEPEKGYKLLSNCECKPYIVRLTDIYEIAFSNQFGRITIMAAQKWKNHLGVWKWDIQPFHPIYFSFCQRNHFGKWCF